MFEGRIGHLEVDSPWGNAGGVVKTPEEVELMAHTGVGWIEAGSYTLEAREGNGPNGEVTYHHTAETGETFNSLGMPNKGMDAVGKQIPEMAEIAHSFGKKLVVNVAPVSDQPVNESRELVFRAYASGADAVLLNAGCPNVVTEDGERHEILSHNAPILGKVVLGLQGITEKYPPVFIRISPGEDYNRIRASLRVLPKEIVSAVFTPNTWPGHVPKDESGKEILEVSRGEGGKSGPAMAEDALRQTAWAISASKIGGRKIDIVSSAGIMTGQELKRRLDLGAVAGAGTTLYYESAEEGWSEATDRMLRQYAEA